MSMRARSSELRARSFRRGLFALLVLAGCSQEVTAQFEKIADDRMPMVVSDTEQFGGGIALIGVGAAIGDVDGDGRPDVYLAGGGLFYNRPDPRGFRFVAADPAAVDPIKLNPTFGATVGDYDRDGDLDLVVCGHGGTQLLRNDNGHFVDVTSQAGVAGNANDDAAAAAFGDINGDGWSDLAVAVIGQPGLLPQASHLYLNRGDGTFEAVVDPLLTADTATRSWSVAFADINGDGVLDLHFSDDAGLRFYSPLDMDRHDHVLINKGIDAKGHPMFEEQSKQLGLGMPHSAMGLSVADPGRIDQFCLFSSDINTEFIFKPNGDHYDDVSNSFKLDAAGQGDQTFWVSWGAQFADFDGNGYEDLIVAQSPFRGRDGFSGAPLYMNRNGAYERTRYAFHSPSQSRAVLAIDVDGDGDQDILSTPFNDAFYLFENTSPPRNYIRVTLRATVSSPEAAGAVLIARAGNQKQRRMRVSGGQPHSQAEATLDLAWPKPLPTDLTVQWPSGAVQQVAAVTPPKSLVIEEPRWLTLSNDHPPADGQTTVDAVVDVGAAGLGGAGTQVMWTIGDQHLSATAGADGKAMLAIPPSSTAGAVFSTLTVGGRTLQAHPVLVYK